METKTNLINEQNKFILFSPHLFLPSGVILIDLFQYLKSLGEQKFFLLISQSVYSKTSERLQELPGYDESAVMVRSGEPTIKEQEQYKEKIRANQYDFVLAVGGGSVLDLAKSIKEDISIPLVVVPTTPATGSEATPYAVLINQENKTKSIINSQKIIPEVVVLDPGLVSSLPKKQLGFSLMDILAHSLEALVSKKSNVLSDSFVFESLRLIKNNYHRLEGDKKILEPFLLSGFLGGLAQNMAAVGLVHAFAHYFGPRYNVPHSQAISLFLEPVLELNMSRTDKYEKLNAANVVSKEDLLSLIQRIKLKFEIRDEKIRLPVDFDRAEAIQKIRRDVCSMTNPILASEEEIAQIIDRCTIIDESKNAN
tara:strand:- start:291 stop:1391 length:1101 start_codon:yes stop_codon:yes gene_type:complete